jgi:hypothetical protein
MKFDMKFQTVGIQIIVVSVLGIILLGACIVTSAANAFVKITTPVKGQHIPVGNILVSGISSSNSTNHCIVSVIINGIKPYQQATSTGIRGPMDYSKWTFNATPEYSTVKEGVNKVTAKYSCPLNVNFRKFYSINVTGVAAKEQPILSTPAKLIVSEFKHTKILKSYS